MIWNEARECMSRDQMTDLQGKHLVKLVGYMYRNVGYYRKKMKKLGLEPGDIHGMEDLDKLPFTTSEDLQDAYPNGMFAVPTSKLVRYGTLDSVSGAELIVGYTQNDLNLWSECMARSVAMAGLNKKDVIQIAYEPESWAEGLGLLSGVEKLGATAIPMPADQKKDLMSSIRKFHVTGIIGTPSYLMYLAHMIEKKGMSGCLLKAADYGGAFWTDKTRKKIQNAIGIKMYDIYGMDELMGLGVAGECRCQKGMHVQEDYFIAEILDTETQTALADGMLGEIVFTTLQKQGVPLIRFRTMNITRINHEKCECGRTSARIDRICARTEDIIYIRGNSILSYSIENALTELREIKACYIVTIKKQHGLDVVEVRIESKRIQELLQSDNGESVKQSVEAVVGKIIGMKPKVYIHEGEMTRLYNRRKVIIIDERRF